MIQFPPQPGINHEQSDQQQEREQGSEMGHFGLKSLLGFPILKFCPRLARLPYLFLRFGLALIVLRKFSLSNLRSNAKRTAGQSEM